MILEMLKLLMGYRKSVYCSPFFYFQVFVQKIYYSYCTTVLYCVEFSLFTLPTKIEKNCGYSCACPSVTNECVMLTP